MRKPALPGTPARGSRTGRPIMALLDLLGRRWSMRLIWELRDGGRRFRELVAATGASPTMVNQRLAELRDAALVDVDPERGYVLTTLGAELLARFHPLNEWAERWARHLGSR